MNLDRKDERTNSVQYDYTHQAWVVDGRYVICAHTPAMHCQCYGRLHRGEPVDPKAEVK